MTALFAIITFFFIFVLVYSTIAALVALATWWMKHRSGDKRGAGDLRGIDRKMDRIKDKAFVIALVLTFFIVTPFVVIYLFVLPR